jgi:hypothetical protein
MLFSSVTYLRPSKKFQVRPRSYISANMVHAVVLGAAGKSILSNNAGSGCSSCISGGIGQPVSLLLKTNPIITKVRYTILF